ncbi:uncharacterized protein LOC108865593 [Pyrus x bretschneideri]|uniref:uncharacterized protein LOC108865593 n=1 Tax=Pyrus x bretschneideri TaxID=225117 RepID=UPI00202EF6A3|nr:uncharacterized protein LOC108865593 [Pyrus x bretschneideri]
MVNATIDNIYICSSAVPFQLMRLPDFTKTYCKASAATAEAAAEWKHKASAFSRISFPERELSKKRKAFFFLHCFCCHCYSGGVNNHRRITITRNRHRPWRMGFTTSTTRLRRPRLRAAELEAERLISVASMEYESSDDNLHFKSKPSRYKASPP